MEYHQAIQNHAGQTVAVINQYLPALKVGNVTATDLQAQLVAFDGLAQTRDDELVDYDQAANVENVGFLGIHSLCLSLPLSAKGEGDDMEVLWHEHAPTHRTRPKQHQPSTMKQSV